MLQLACLRLARYDRNSNMIQLESLQSAFYLKSAVCILALVCNLSPGLQSAFYTGWISISNLQSSLIVLTSTIR